MKMLDELIRDTMLGKASTLWTYNHLPFHPIEPMPEKVPEQLPFFDSLDADRIADVVAKNPIWRFDSPAFSGSGVSVSNVTCKVRSMA